MLRTQFVLFCLLASSCLALSETAQSIAPKYHIDDQYLYEMECTLDMTQNVSEPEKANVTYWLSIHSATNVKVKEVRPDRSADLIITLIKPRLQFSVKNSDSENDLFNLSFDSSKESEIPLPPFQYITPITKCLDGAEFIVAVDSNGRITEIKNLQPIRRKMEKKLDPSVPQEIKDQVCSLIQSEASLAVMKYFTCYLPDHDVKLGESWIGDTTPLELGDKHRWTLSKLGENQLRIEKSYKVTEDQMKRLVGDGIFKKADVTVQEAIHMDKESFLVLSNRITASTKAHQKMPLPDGRELDATYDVKGKLTLTKQMER